MCWVIKLVLWYGFFNIKLQPFYFKQTFHFWNTFKHTLYFWLIFIHYCYWVIKQNVQSTCLQANKFMQRFHYERVTKLSLILESEAWRQAEVPVEFQQLLNQISESGEFFVHLRWNNLTKQSYFAKYLILKLIEPFNRKSSLLEQIYTFKRCNSIQLVTILIAVIKTIPTKLCFAFNI